VVRDVPPAAGLQRRDSSPPPDAAAHPRRTPPPPDGPYQPAEPDGSRPRWSRSSDGSRASPPPHALTGHLRPAGSAFVDRRGDARASCCPRRIARSTCCRRGRGYPFPPRWAVRAEHQQRRRRGRPGRSTFVPLAHGQTGGWHSAARWSASRCPGGSWLLPVAENADPERHGRSVDSPLARRAVARRVPDGVHPWLV
jgi:hypothetical protein